MDKYYKKHKRQQLFFFSCCLFAFILLGLIFLRSPYKVHITNNFLQTPTLNALKAIDKPLSIEAFIPSGADTLKNYIKDFFTPYLNNNTSLTFKIKDPKEHPNEVASLMLNPEGDIIFHYQEKSVILDKLNETSVRQLLTSLVKKPNILLINEASNLNQFKTLIKNHQFNLIEQREDNINLIADNIDLVILTGYNQLLPEHSQKAIIDYIKSGRNLLSFIDNKNTDQLKPITQALGFTVTKQQIFNNSAYQAAINDDQSIIIKPDTNDTNNELSSLFKKINQYLYFKTAYHIESEKSKDWETINFLKTKQRSYLIENQNFIEEGDTYYFGILHKRPVLNTEQSIMTIADQDFLTDYALTMGDNKTFILAAINNLTQNQINNNDNTTIMLPNTFYYLSGIFIFLIPLLFFISIFIFPKKRR